MQTAKPYFFEIATMGNRDLKMYSRQLAPQSPPTQDNCSLIMGRKAAALKSKSVVVVQFPHDGPIHNHYIRGRNEDGENDENEYEDQEIRVALDLLASLGDDSSPQKVTKMMTDPSWVLTRNLCQTLRSASGIKDQLQALQSYRSTVLNWKQPISSNGSSALSTPYIFDESLAGALYRLFLEWSLSAHTPLPLQRVLHSCMHTLDPDGKELICSSVLRSLWAQDSSTALWEDPLHSLDVAVNAPFLSSILQTTLFDDCLSFIYCRWAEPLLQQLHLQNSEGAGQADAATQGLFLAKLLKVLLQNVQSDQIIIPFCSEFEALVSLLMKCPTMPTEGFNTLGIVYAKLYLQGKSKSSSQQSVSKAAILAVQSLDEEDSSSDTTQIMLSILARLSIVQGISATLDLESLLCVVSLNDNKRGDDDDESTPLEVCWKYSLHASQVATDAMDRWAALKGLSTLAGRWKQCQQQLHGNDIIETDGPSSPVGTHVHQHLFDALILDTLEVVLQAWENPPLRKLGTAIPGIFQTLVQLLPPSKRQELCRTVLDQPLNRKGRYLALEILLPYFPTDKDETSLIRADSLLEGVGDRGPNSGAIADLWIKLLGFYWNENTEESNLEESFSEWTRQWVPSLSRALLEGELSRRKQVAAFCIVRLLDWIKRTKSLQSHLSESMVLLLNHISSEAPSSSENATDRVLWAYLELARQLHLQKVMTPDVKVAIAEYVPPSRLRWALTHESSSLRLAAFRSLESMVGNVYNEGILEEAEMWKGTIPFSIKSTDKQEYTTEILLCLTTFLDRFSAWEATFNTETETDVPLQNFYSFAADFVIGRLTLKLGVYPGTVVDKEEFSLVLLETMLAFVLQDQSFSSDNATRNGIVFQRKRQEAEQATMSALLKCILQQEAFAALFSLLHSPWDGTRAIAFRVLSKLVVAAHSKDLPLPEAYSDDLGLHQLKSRGFYLASSPRQREADTGSRFLAFVFMSKKSGEERDQYLSELIGLLSVRLLRMKECLKDVLNNGPSAVDSGTALPLAHGIIHAILLTVQHQKLLVKTQSKINSTDQARNQLYENLIGIFCEAIQLSLNIVADVRDGESVEGMDDTLFGDGGDENTRSSGTPLNVNTGAIGANGNFSKLAQTNEEAQEHRLTVQRVVVGTWLLTKETCAAASAVIAAQDFDASPDLVQKFGTLLISTLTSLKHAGAAFSARDSLQEIAIACIRSNKEELQSIPEKWIDRLLDEMCSVERVRDSTLRRSTGYALGFLALMRSELAIRSSVSMMCSRVLTRLVAYSLPAENQLKSTLSGLNVLRKGRQCVASVFYSSTFDTGANLLLPDSRYEARCRVHALNVLRMIILDAPLADVMRPFIGDAIVSSLLGYSDPSWAVRNSATMVFSAAMLRVVDADKNASNTDRTSSQAMTVTELFRRYPVLSTFLPAMMEHCLVDQDKQVNSQLFPILQLFSRIQPVAHSGGVPATQAYPGIIRKALGNKHHAIRAVAARSLANVCSDEMDSPSSFFWSLKISHSALMEPSDEVALDWNAVDGNLLAISSMLSAGLPVRNVLFDLGIHSTLMRIIQVKDGSTQYPPSCISTAVDILAQIAVDSDQRKPLIVSCMDIVDNRKFERMAGGALAYESAAKATIMLMQGDIWDPSQSSTFGDSLASLQSLLSSDLIDVRLVAVKAFKKTIYKNIDQILSQTAKRAVNADQTLSRIAAVLLRCMEVEMNRPGSAQDCLGPHVPTVRRLSRCFLECFDGYQNLNEPAHLFMVQDREQNGALWRTAMAMVEHEQFLREPAIEPNGEAFLSGNAAELMSIQIASDLVSENLEDQKLETFVKVICHLNNSQASWRSRFSATKAVENSRTLELPAHSKLRGRVLRELLEILQDSDPDVRKCAARAARYAESLGQRNDEGPLSGLPVPTLCRLYPVVFRSKSGDEAMASMTINSLLKIVLENSRGLVPAIQALDAEMEQTRNIGDPSTLTHSSAGRRIFEEEDPNPFNERLLSSQLAIQAMVRCPPCEYSTATNETGQSLLRELFTAMTSIRKTSDRRDLTHDMSRFPVVFPSLHGLLGTIVASIFVGLVVDDDQVEIQQLAKGFLESSSSSMHPEIMAVTECLLHAQRGDEATKISLEKCLFLL